jgi:hypothetical protein
VADVWKEEEEEDEEGMMIEVDATIETREVG